VTEPTTDQDLLQLALAGTVGPRATSPAGTPRAAVAAIFADGDGDGELLFIERASRAGDPWSGHMGFPGGRAEPSDVDSYHTAERETREEVGLDLVASAKRLGSLLELDGGRASRRTIIVAAHCYWLVGERPELRPNHEVADVVWVPLATLLDPDRHIDYQYPPSGLTFPGIQLDRPNQVIWGLTLRLLGDLFERLDRAFII
jgi:8-oxo-dGTP pyrophosphatase MutT (NUDIX family)